MPRIKVCVGEGGVSDISYRERHITLDGQITWGPLGPLQIKSGVILGNGPGWLIVCACVCVHILSHMYLCALEGISLEEQVRRIKDIEAIESDSFVPQAFKSSRDDTKVHFSSLSVFPSPSRSLIGFASPPSVQRQPRPNQTFIQRSPFVSPPTRDGFMRCSAVERLPQ